MTGASAWRQAALEIARPGRTGVPGRWLWRLGCASVAAAVAITETLEGSELQVGAGLNSGTVVAGNVGGAGRFEFSVIGDVVNTAARVEAATRQTGDTILVTEDTKRLARQSGYRFAPRSDIQLKGKAAAVRLYAPSRLET